MKTTETMQRKKKIPKATLNAAATQEATAKKAKESRKSTQGNAEKASIALEQYKMIAVAAYYRAERRGFCGGHELEDWIEAEAEIDRVFGLGGLLTHSEGK